MADRANSTGTSAVHPFTGSTPPSGAPPCFAPVTAAEPAQPGPVAQVGRACPAAPDTAIFELARQVVALLRREPIVVREIDMLARHHLLPKKHWDLERSLSRLRTRLDRLTGELAAARATTIRGAAAKADALTEMAQVEGRTGDPFDRLATSLARDACRLGLDEACLPDAPPPRRTPAVDDTVLFDHLDCYTTAHRRYLEAPEAEITAADEALKTVEDEIDQCLPRSAAGFAAKARWVLARDPDHETDFANSFLRQIASLPPSVHVGRSLIGASREVIESYASERAA